MLPDELIKGIFVNTASMLLCALIIQILKHKKIILMIKTQLLLFFIIIPPAIISFFGKKYFSRMDLLFEFVAQIWLFIAMYLLVFKKC